MGINIEIKIEADINLHVMHINADMELSELSDIYKYGINDGFEINGRVLVSVPIKYVEEQISDMLPKLTPTASEEMGEKKWLWSLASNITSDMSTVVAVDHPCRSQ